MPDKVLLENEEYHINEEDFPCLVTCGEGMGGSHLSIVFVAGLFLRGSKILFLTAYPMAKEKFLEQVGSDHSKITFVDSVEDLGTASSAQAIMIQSGNEALFLEAIKKITDLEERIVLVKNIEKFSDNVFDACLPLDKVLLSGHLDECTARERISKKIFKTIIAFNKTQTPLPVQIPELPKWNGYLQGTSRSGLITIPKSE